MEVAGQPTFQSPSHDAGVIIEQRDRKPNAPSINESTGQHAPHKPTPLQVSETATSPSSSESPRSMRSPRTPTAFNTTSDLQSSPRSPRPSLAAEMEQSQSPRERLTEFLASESTNTNGYVPEGEVRNLRSMTASPLKAQSYGQLRKLSSPLPDTRPLGNSSPPSPRSTASPPLVGSKLNPQGRQMPRTSSIDSAISSISFGASQAQKPSVDSIASATPDISNLIKVAGSPEAVIQHLLKEKQQTDARSGQLWTLVDKQRKLILGLHQDLDRALKDKDRYKKKLKDYQDSVPPVPSTDPKTPASQPRNASHSSAQSDNSADLPIQKQSLEQARPLEPPACIPSPKPSLGGQSEKSEKHAVGVAPLALEEENNWVRNKGRGAGSNHAHMQTSSSDIGVFGIDKPIKSIAPLQTRDLDQAAESSGHPTSPQSPLTSKPVVSPTSSFTAKRRSQGQTAKPFNGPALALTEATPPGNDHEKMMTPPRKAPPAPLDLVQPTKESPIQHLNLPENDSESDYEDQVEVDELPVFDRGRKKTREDDDREREAALMQEQKDRSRSKKTNDSKSRSDSKTLKAKSEERDKKLPAQTIPIPTSIKALSPEPIPALTSSFLSEPTSLASVLNPSDMNNTSNISERSITMKHLASPGLPLSPRPIDRPMKSPMPRMPRDGAAASIASPPLSPRNNFVGLPLSPRAPRQPIPFPPHTPMSIAPSSPMSPNMVQRDDPNHAGQDSTNQTKTPSSLDTRLDTQNARYGSPGGQAPRPNGIFRGFMSEAYPGLLIPPNALPSIKITVVSSRLKPSRNSLVLKGADEEPVFTLGVSARFDHRDLWLVEKPILSLQHLDSQLRQSPAFNVKLPDRSLFSGHAPAKVDARRLALEKYFEQILDIQMDERAAVALCNYLSTNVSEPKGPETNGTVSALPTGSPVTQDSDRRLTKEGYLTKRGKNFGGWKARFFILDEPVLRYYETPGGTLLGTINLHNAQIGKQAQAKQPGSPSRSDEGDGQYRHAFLIRQPKRKDSNSYMDHVLCAESDAERDAWVTALLCYVEGFEVDGKSRPPVVKNDSGSSKTAVLVKKNSLKKTVVTSDSPESDGFDSLQAVPYEETRQAPPPYVQITPDPRPNADSPSPTASGQPQLRAPSAQTKAISGPQNGAKISNVGAWGNKPMASPLPPNPKEQKKRSLWGFHNKDASHLGAHHSNDSDLSLTQLQYQEQITNVKAAFGAPLAEAVEYCAPQGVGDVCLPAVVYRCLQYLTVRNAANEVGIFRQSGSNITIKKLKTRFNAEGDYDLLADPDYDVHAVASLLKLYLRELPAMILTRELHMKFLSVLELKDNRQKIAAYNVCVHKLPKANFHLLRALSEYLITVVQNSEVNLMSIRNVCIVFSPTLNIPNPVFTMFLTQFESIFGKPPEDVSVPTLEVTHSDPLTPDDIRSPRRQMFSEIPTPSYNQETFSSNHQQPTPRSPNKDTKLAHHTGFIPIQPAYDTPMSIPYTQTQDQGSVTVPGPEYAVARPRNLAPGGPAKQRRRESSMLLMNNQRTSSLPMLGSENGTTFEESEFA